MSGKKPAGTRRAVIVTGGNLGEWALAELSPEDYLIGADSGADFLVHHGLKPDLALGDFDSVPPGRVTAIGQSSRELLAVDAVDKDWTDTELAVREAVKRGFGEILILGGLGTRFDHSLANVQLLRQAKAEGSEAILMDANNQIRLCTGTCTLSEDGRFPYVSLLPLSAAVTGVTLTGFRYPLNDATLTLGWSLGVSNVLDKPVGTVTLSEGQLLIIRSRD